MNTSINDKYCFKRNVFNAALAKKGLTLGKLAEKLNISQSTLSYKLKDNGSFKIDEIRVLIDLFGMEEVSDFLFNL